MAASRETKTPPGAAPTLDYDAIIIGAGMSGMYQLYRLRELGMRVRVLEAGTGIGGTWYWNRYPGARFDSESYSYGYSFSKKLLEEWDWSEHFAGQPETAALSQSRRRQVRPAPRHPVPQPGHCCKLCGGYPQLERHAARWQPLPRALPDHRHRAALRPYDAADRRRRHVWWQILSHRQMAA
jgi:phytoene dehydrogenase-like protein